MTNEPSTGQPTVCSLRHFSFTAICFLLLAHTPAAVALGPVNLLVIVNTNSQESLAVANYYRALRQVPARNFVFLDYQGDAIQCDWEQFKTSIYDPAKLHIAEEGLAKQICAWVTTPSLPYRIGVNSVSGVIFFGKETPPSKSKNLGPAGFEELNRYYFSLDSWQPALSEATGAYLHMMLTAGSLNSTLAMIERSVNATVGDQGDVYLFEGDGPRGSRRVSIPQAKLFLDLLGRRATVRSGSQLQGAKDVIGVYTGAIKFPCADNAYLAGAIGDHLTSFGGAFLDSRKQMPCTDFLTHGCSASYGTVVEPYNYPQKFPTAMVHAYYAMGFSALESYWMSIAWPHQGLFVGDPLARPFGTPPTLAIDGFSESQTVSGSIQANVTSEIQVPGPGVSHVDVFVDEKHLNTVGQASFPPGVEVTVTIGSEKVVYPVQTTDRVSDILRGLGKEIESKWSADVLARGGSLMISRMPGEADKSIHVESNSPVVSIEVVGDGFQHYEPNANKKVEMAWLRIGAGLKRLAFSTQIDTTGLVDGRHQIRLVAHRGRATQIESTLIQEFVVRNGDKRMTLQATEPTGNLNSSRMRVCEAILSDGATGEIVFVIDGRQAAVDSEAPYALEIYPRDWGQGPHQVSALLRQNGKTVLLSDNWLTFDIQP